MFVIFGRYYTDRIEKGVNRDVENGCVLYFVP